MGYCLTYALPLGAAGLSWADLVEWWQQENPAWMMRANLGEEDTRFSDGSRC